MKAYIDRFENDKAVLILQKEKESIFIPRKILPNDCREGDVLVFSVKIDKPETEKEKQRISKLQKNLKKDN